jgi:predicted DNA binding CopG/RHH family protein
MKTLKEIPKFKNEQEEAEFWQTHDSTEYLDWSQAKQAIFPNLKPTTESISLRLPAPLLARIKELANEKDVPYQSLMKVYLSDRVTRELTSNRE